jgi:hypothetical protein
MNRAILSMLVIGLVGVSYAQPPAAGWNFGADTYGQHTDHLILNSLSDRYGISTFDTPTQSLGTNDYISENAVKNQLALEGYTKAYDFNPQSKTGYGYSSVYNEPLPNIPLTKLTFMGMDGDPTKSQDVYVLTSEYNKLSAQSQADSISTLNSGLTDESGRAIKAEGVLQNSLNTEIVSRMDGDKALQSQIETVNRKVDNVGDRVNNLERMKVMPEAVVRFYDAKHLSMAVYDSYDATNGRNFAIGMRVTLKLGRSWEEKQLEILQRKLDTLQAIVATRLGD